MLVFKKYIEKHAAYNSFISETPDGDLQNIIVIPCYNEPDILSTINSLVSCKEPINPVEVIIVINSADNTDAIVLEQNKKTETEITDFISTYYNSRLRFYVISIKDVPNRFAGVGFARKVGMDEAISRFSAIDNVNGVITGFDADSVVEENYGGRICLCIMLSQALI